MLKTNMNMQRFYDELYARTISKKRLKELEAMYRQWFGERVECARKECGITIEQMMEILGVSKNQVIKWRKGTNWGNPLVIARIAHALKKPFNYFIHPDFRLSSENRAIEVFLEAYGEGQRGLEVKLNSSKDRSRHHISAA